MALTAKALDLYEGPIVNLQGDALLTDPQTIRDIVDVYQDRNPDGGTDFPNVVTPVIECDGDAMRLLDAGGIGGAVYTAIDFYDHALYFSRSLLYSDRKRLYQHLGLYVYSREALDQYILHEPAGLETAERLEPTRFR